MPRCSASSVTAIEPKQDKMFSLLTFYCTLHKNITLIKRVYFSKISYFAFKWINQPDASISHIHRSSFKYSLTCFGHPLAHHQELINCSVVGRGRSGRTDHDQQHCYHHVPMVKQRRLLQFISFWWWARGCPKYVELYLKDERWIWETDASGWLIYLNVWWCTDLKTINSYLTSPRKLSLGKSAVVFPASKFRLFLMFCCWF
jgi:hypothetical protein